MEGDQKNDCRQQVVRILLIFAFTVCCFMTIFYNDGNGNFWIIKSQKSTFDIRTIAVESDLDEATIHTAVAEKELEYRRSFATIGDCSNVPDENVVECEKYIKSIYPQGLTIKHVKENFCDYFEEQFTPLCDDGFITHYSEKETEIGIDYKLCFFALDVCFDGEKIGPFSLEYHTFIAVRSNARDQGYLNEITKEKYSASKTIYTLTNVQFADQVDIITSLDDVRHTANLIKEIIEEDVCTFCTNVDKKLKKMTIVIVGGHVAMERAEFNNKNNGEALIIVKEWKERSENKPFANFASTVSLVYVANKYFSEQESGERTAPLTPDQLNEISDQRVQHNLIHEIAHILHSMTDREMFLIACGGTRPSDEFTYSKHIQPNKNIVEKIKKDVSNLYIESIYNPVHNLREKKTEEFFVELAALNQNTQGSRILLGMYKNWAGYSYALGSRNKEIYKASEVIAEAFLAKKLNLDIPQYIENIYNFYHGPGYRTKNDEPSNFEGMKEIFKIESQTAIESFHENLPTYGNTDYKLEIFNAPNEDAEYEKGIYWIDDQTKNIFLTVQGGYLKFKNNDCEQVECHRTFSEKLKFWKSRRWCHKCLVHYFRGVRIGRAMNAFAPGWFMEPEIKQTFNKIRIKNNDNALFRELDQRSEESN